jgi:hypothetical protein
VAFRDASTKPRFSCTVFVCLSLPAPHFQGAQLSGKAAVPANVAKRVQKSKPQSYDLQFLSQCFNLRLFAHLLWESFKLTPFLEPRSTVPESASRSRLNLDRYDPVSLNMATATAPIMSHSRLAYSLVPIGVHWRVYSHLDHRRQSSQSMRSNETYPRALQTSWPQAVQALGGTAPTFKLHRSMC